MPDLSIYDAWRLWWNGVPLQDYTLWGHKMLWYARGGKFLEFLGALTIVIDIVGPARIRKTGENLRQWFSFADSRQRVRVYSERIKRALHWNPPYREVTFKDILTDSMLCSSLILSILIVVGAWQRFPYDSWWIKVPVLVLALMVLPSLLPWIMLAAVGILSMLMLGLNYAVFRQMARLLTLSKVEKWMKGFAAVCIAIGFHFDFLTS